MDRYKGGIYMKCTKLLIGVASLTLILAMNMSCASTPAAVTQPVETKTEEKKTLPAKKAKHVERELIDWKGSAIGQDIPVWVEYAVDSDYDSLGKIKTLEGKEVFLAEDRGKNLNILKSWTNNFDVQSNFAKSITNYVLSSFGGVLEGSVNKEADESYLEELVGTFSKAKVVGLVKKMDYWVQTRVIDNDANKSEDIYQYFVVYAMERDDYRNLIDEALGKVDARTEREQELKNEARNIALGAAVLSVIDEAEQKESSEESSEDSNDEVEFLER